jgi:16S rRNA processing protein RimM
MHSSDEAPQRIAIGCVRKPFGLKGHCYVEAFGKALPALRVPSKVLVGRSAETANEAMLREKKETPKGYICRFDGQEDVDQVQTLRGAYLFMEQNRLPPPEGNEYYHFELEGMTVIALPENKPIGVVLEVQNFPTVDALNIRREDGSEVLISLRQGIIAKIDRENNCINVHGSALEQIL